MSSPDKKSKKSELRRRAEKRIKLVSHVSDNMPADDVRKLAHDLQIHQVELEMQNEEQRRIQTELEESHAKYEDLYDFAPVGYFTLDSAGLIREANITGSEMLGIKRKELVKKPFSLFVNHDDKDAFYLHYKKLLGTKTLQHIEVRLKTANDSDCYVYITFLPVLDKEDNIILVRTIVNDVNERKHMEMDLALAKKEWEQTFDTIPDIVMVIDNNYKIVRANRALAEKLKIKREDLIGKTCYEVIHSADAPPPYCTHQKVIESGMEMTDDIYEKNLDDYFILSSTPIFDAEGNMKGVVEVFREITVRKKIEEKLRTVSITDDLTGLFNRRGFYTLAEQQLKLAARNMKSLCLLYLDLNNMKQINDQFGHKAGDNALTDTAGILRKTFRESDIIARMGGDEFAVLLTEIPLETNTIIISHLIDNITNHNKNSSAPYEISISVGTAYYDPKHKCSVTDLLSRADSMMYMDKKRRLKKEVVVSHDNNREERRIHRRIRANKHCMMKLDTQESIDIEDISEGGIHFKTSERLSTKKNHKVTLYCNGDQVTVNGILVWAVLATSGDDTKSTAACYDAGMKFIGLTKKDNRSIGSIISKVAGRNQR